MADYIQFNELPAVKYNTVRWKLPKPPTVYCPCCDTACKLNYVDKDDIIAWVSHCMWCDFMYVVSGDQQGTGDWGNALPHARIRGLLDQVPTLDDPASSEEVRDDLVPHDRGHGSGVTWHGKEIRTET